MTEETQNANDFDIVESTQTTARNIYELLLNLAAHIRKLEAENASLKARLSDDLK
jgi:hypothetical protein